MERSACTTGPIGSAAMTPQGPYWSARAGERRLPEESELPDGHDRSQRGRREYRNGDRLPVYCSADRRSQGILERKIPRNPVDGGQPGHPSIRLDCGAASLRSTAPQSNYTTTTGHFICYRKRTSSLATDTRQWNLGDVSPPVARSRSCRPVRARSRRSARRRPRRRRRDRRMFVSWETNKAISWPCGSTPVRIGDAGVRVLVDELDAVAADIAGVTFLLIRARGGSLVDEDATVTSRSAGEPRIISNPSTHAGAGADGVSR